MRRLGPEEAAKPRRRGFPTAVLETVAPILTAVRERGDEALLEMTERFDRVKLRASELEVPPEQMERAWDGLGEEFRRDLQLARDRIFAYHASLKPGSALRPEPGLILGQLVRPLDRVGIYVPGGRAPLFSSVLMTAVPARVAGVSEIVAVTPPGPEGRVDPHLLAAAHLAGVDRLFRVGGAQAVAALAYGTATIPAVEKIVGPGNLYVTAAQRLLYGEVGIDLLAGPSEVVILADEGAEPELVAEDLLAQAEHDPAAASFLVTTSERLADRVEKALERELKKLERRETAAASLAAQGGIVIVPDLGAGVAVVNAIAPEHLGLALRDPWAVLPLIRAAGAVFLGDRAPEALGDYVAGPSHVLPTGGTARFFSPLGVESFLKRISLIAPVGEIRELEEAAARLARREGLTAHARAIEMRGRVGRDG